jgi:serine/threonine protein kinase
LETAGHYRILDRIGSGGMGVVFKAEDTRLRRTVALKFLPGSMTGDDRAVARLTREARTASSLNHPNICTIYDIGEADGRPFIAMEFLEGQPLNDAIGTRPLATARLIDLGIQIADALDAAHVHGIVHRDIKPANIFITRRDHVKVLDFGIARPGPEPAPGGDVPVVPDDVETLLVTQPGTVSGTLAYMSPEQALSKPVDARSDLFSLGLVLFEMATGRQGFDGHTPAAIYDAILNRQPPPARDLNPALPAGLDGILSRALEKDPDLRYQTASDMRADLQRLKRNLETQGLSKISQTAPAPDETTAAAGRPRVVWIGVAAVGVAAIGVGTVLFLNSQRGSSNPPAPVVNSALPPPPASAPLAASSPPLPPEGGSHESGERGGSPASGGRSGSSASDASRGAKPAPSVSRPAVKAETPPASPSGSPPATTLAGRGELAAGRGRGAKPEVSQEVKAARGKIQAGDIDGAIADLKKLTAAPHVGAPLDAYGTLLDAENRRGRRADFTATLDDIAKRYPSDPRVPLFLLGTAKAAFKSQRPGRVIFARELAKKVVDAYPASPAVAEAQAMVNQIEAARGRGRIQ